MAQDITSMTEENRNDTSVFSGWSSRFLPPALIRCICEPFFRRMGCREERALPQLERLERIVIVRLDEIGDFVMFSPFLRELRRNCPLADITLVVRPAILNLTETCPHIDQVLTYDPEAGRLIYLRRLWKSWRFAQRELWCLRPEVALLPRWDVDLAGATFVAYFSGAPIRIGHSEKLTESHRRENKGYDILLTNALSDRTIKHEVLHNLDLLRSLDGIVDSDKLELWLNREDKAFANSFLSRRGNRDTKWLALGPGSRLPRKNWPVSRFVDLAKQLHRETGIRPLALLGPGDTDIATAFESAGGDLIAVAMGQTLRQTAALLARCSLFVGGDSGPKHMAAAMGVPLVEINASPVNADASHPNTTSPERFGPWGVAHRVVGPTALQSPCKGACTACEAHCILRVSTESVATEARALLSETANTSTV